jgi:uncharacterized protein YecE (DUF72 family)
MNDKGNLPAQLYIATSNIILPGNKQTFPPSFRSTTRLHYYAHHFNSLEINRSFYKTPLYRTFKKWAEDVPADFRFSVKLTRQITHQKNLFFDQQIIADFMNAAAGIGEKKGCLLIQFPGKITLDYFNKVESILSYIKNFNLSHSWKIAIEFRHASWYITETYQLLALCNAVMVLHDMPSSMILETAQTLPFIYLRLHGPSGNYRGSYSTVFLQYRAAQIRLWLQQGKAVFIYFNNTIGNAFQNAITLKEIIDDSDKKSL